MRDGAHLELTASLARDQAVLDRVARLAHPRETDDADIAWLRAGLRRWLSSDEPVDLEQALELPPRRRRAAIAAAHRKAALQRALELVDGETDWARCAALAREASRFRSLVWPRWSKLPAPPADASALRLALDAAFRVGDVPTTPGGIYSQLFRTCE